MGLVIFTSLSRGLTWLILLYPDHPSACSETLESSELFTHLVHTKGFGKELLVNRGRIRAGHIFCTRPNTNCRILWLSFTSQCLQKSWHLRQWWISTEQTEVIEMWTSCLRWSDHSPDDLQPEKQDQAFPGIILFYKWRNTWRSSHNSPFLVQKSCPQNKPVPASRSSL